jgi:hypothetical protein
MCVCMRFHKVCYEMEGQVEFDGYEVSVYGRTSDKGRLSSWCVSLGVTDLLARSAITSEDWPGA